jgi:hypothetical protein
MFYVSSILNGKVTIERIGDQQWDLPAEWVVPDHSMSLYEVAFFGDAQLAKVLEKLRDRGVAFGGELSGWPPSAIFERLRALGLLHGPYTELSFRSPGNWVTRER